MGSVPGIDDGGASGGGFYLRELSPNEAQEFDYSAQHGQDVIDHAGSRSWTNGGFNDGFTQHGSIIDTGLPHGFYNGLSVDQQVSYDHGEAALYKVAINWRQRGGGMVPEVWDPLGEEHPVEISALTAQAHGGAGLMSLAHDANGVFAWSGAWMIRSEIVRNAYNNAISHLRSSGDSAARTALKAHYRNLTPQPMRAYIRFIRGDHLGPREGSYTSANRANPLWNKGAAIVGDLGRASVGASLAIDLVSIATAENRREATFEAAGSTIGGLAEGWAGAELGSEIGSLFGGPPGALAGAIIGGLFGSFAGGFAGDFAADYLYDLAFEDW